MVYSQKPTSISMETAQMFWNVPMKKSLPKKNPAISLINSNIFFHQLFLFEVAYCFSVWDSVSSWKQTSIMSFVPLSRNSEIRRFSDCGLLHLQSPFAAFYPPRQGHPSVIWRTSSFVISWMSQHMQLYLVSLNLTQLLQQLANTNETFPTFAR